VGIFHLIGQGIEFQLHLLGGDEPSDQQPHQQGQVEGAGQAQQNHEALAQEVVGQHIPQAQARQHHETEVGEPVDQELMAAHASQ
jgi:hypothetical protein